MTVNRNINGLDSEYGYVHGWNKRGHAISIDHELRIPVLIGIHANYKRTKFRNSILTRVEVYNHEL